MQLQRRRKKQQAVPDKKKFAPKDCRGPESWKRTQNPGIKQVERVGVLFNYCEPGVPGVPGQLVSDRLFVPLTPIPTASQAREGPRGMDLSSQVLSAHCLHTGPTASQPLPGIGGGRPPNCEYGIRVDVSRMISLHCPR